MQVVDVCKTALSNVGLPGRTGLTHRPRRAYRLRPSAEGSRLAPLPITHASGARAWA